MTLTTRSYTPTTGRRDTPRQEGARAWNALFLAGAIAVNSVHVPLHLLAEAHDCGPDLHETEGVVVPAHIYLEGEDDHDPHGPHSIYDHQALKALAANSQPGTVYLAAGARASFGHEPAAGTPLTPLVEIEPRAIPPPSPRQPRAPPTI